MKQRTDVSTDNMKTVSEPPTVIVEDRMHLDPIKVIKAWSESADVLRDVATAVRENQQDNDNVRTVLVKQFKAIVVVSVLTTMLHLVAVGSVIWTNLETRQYVQKVCPALGSKR